MSAAEAEAIAEIRDEIGEIIAMLTCVQKPGEKLTSLQAITRYWRTGMHDDAVYLAVLCARGDPDADDENLPRLASEILQEAIEADA